MKHNQNGFSIVEVIIVILGVGLLGLGGWYVWSRSKSEDIKSTSNTTTESNKSDEAAKVETPKTNTYQNKTLGFSFEYPKDWAKTNDTTTVPANVRITSPDYKLVDGTSFGEIETGGAFGVEVVDSANGHKDIYAYRDAEGGGIYAVGTKGDGTTTDITLNGVPAVRGTACGHPTKTMDCVVFIKNGLFYWITYSRKAGEASTSATYAKDYQALLESFKFD